VNFLPSHRRLFASSLGLSLVVGALCFAQNARAFTLQLQNSGKLLVMSNVNVTVQYNLTNGLASFAWQNRTVISQFYSGAGLSIGYIKGTNYTSWTYLQSASNQVVVTATGNGHPTMKQFFTFDQSNSFLIRLEMDGTNLSGNWLGPVVVDATGGVDIGSYGDDRALFVPFDNDHFIQYNAMSINSSDVSYEVGAFYDNVSRAGLVVGSVTHDTWKSGVYWSGSGNKLNSMNVYGGAVSSSVTWDVMPHGSVYGNSISSPTMFVGYGPDWRRTMESFADENAAMVPRLAWNGGVPFGWNSWGVIQKNINYTDATNAAGFIYNNLQPTNFSNNGTVYVNLDSYWDNLSSSDLQSFVNYCHAHGQKCGLYLAPFTWFGAATNASNTTMQGSGYTYSQAILKTTNGAFEINDGGLALDPTHPGTLLRISYYFNIFLTDGIDYLKLDFLTHGALEGVHFNTNITTGIQAYNSGMQYMNSQLGGQLFLSESIAPLFPYQYGHSRRIACDAEASAIGNTEYTLNSVSYGWWLDRLYNFNDPDIMVFAGPTTNENQARAISAAITGLFLDGDSFLNAASDQSASSSLTNAGIDAVARLGRTFVATEGNTGTNAATVFTSQTNGISYLAVFNYSATPGVTNIDLTRAGIPPAPAAADLWNGSVVPVTNQILTVALNAKQGRLFEFLNPPVLQTPQIKTNGMNNGSIFSFNLAANAGFNYNIQSSVDLTNWSTIETIPNPSGVAQVVVSNPNAPTPFFYRAALAQ
jgi:hypothetical protein